MLRGKSSNSEMMSRELVTVGRPWEEWGRKTEGGRRKGAGGVDAVVDSGAGAGGSTRCTCSGGSGQARGRG